MPQSRMDLGSAVLSCKILLSFFLSADILMIYAVDGIFMTLYIQRNFLYPTKQTGIAMSLQS